jgi:hypothetical protein
MAEKNKSIIESALLDAKRIQEALNANTKEILRSVAIEEIDGLVKESLEEGYVEEDADETDDVEVTATDDTDETDDVDSDEIEVDDTDELGVDAEEDSTEDDLVGGDVSMSAAALGGDSKVSDMTTAPIDDVISVYRKLTGDDEIEVVVDDESGEIKLTVNEPGEFVIKTGADSAEVEDEFDADEIGDDETDEVDEVMYEIALEEMENIDGIKAPIGDNTGDNLQGGFDDDQTYAHAEGDMVMSEGMEIKEGGYSKEFEDMMHEFCKKHPNDSQCKSLDESKMEEGKDAMEEVEDKMEEGDEKIDEKIAVGTGMSVGNNRNASGPGSIGAPENPKSVNESANKYNTLLTEAKELRGKNEEYKQALKQFRTMLAETVVFNSNLTYVTKLFMEHSTTKEEKQGILKRFDNEVSTLKESKRLYKTIVSELSSRKPMNESIERKLNNEVSSGMSKQLNESTAYIDKETQRIKDLMSRVEKR